MLYFVMLYSKHITVSAGTTIAASNKTYIKVNRGMIYYIWATVPAGCNNLVHWRIFHQGHPFLPVNRDAYISGNNFTYQFPSFQEIKDNPEILMIECWSPDTSHAHNLSFQILILPKKYIMPVGAMEGIMESLENLIIRRGEKE